MGVCCTGRVAGVELPGACPVRCTIGEMEWRGDHVHAGHCLMPPAPPSFPRSSKRIRVHRRTHLCSSTWRNSAQPRREERMLRLRLCSGNDIAALALNRRLHAYVSTYYVRGRAVHTILYADNLWWRVATLISCGEGRGRTCADMEDRKE